MIRKIQFNTNKKRKHFSLRLFIYSSMLCCLLISYCSEYTTIKIDEVNKRMDTIRNREATKSVINYYEMDIITTAYSELDSCHYPLCIMANGEVAHVGAIACNFLSFGTRVEIDGVIYVVKDRHAKWLEDRIDIFFGYGGDAHERALQYGKRIKRVKVLDF